MHKDAAFSGCEKYRYLLRRIWNVRERQSLQRNVCFIMLNPSTADYKNDDATIRRCIGFAQRWGYDGIEVVNLFGWRTRWSKELKDLMSKGIDPVGPDNDRFMMEVARTCPLVVCAWGKKGSILERQSIVLKMLREALVSPRAIRITELNTLEHPLYLPKDLGTRLIPRYIR